MEYEVDFDMRKRRREEKNIFLMEGGEFFSICCMLLTGYRSNETSRKGDFWSFPAQEAVIDKRQRWLLKDLRLRCNKSGKVLCFFSADRAAKLFRKELVFGSYLAEERFLCGQREVKLMC
ncbi:hypothetical protein TNIN_335191 [Trichonephila inaurata madagascariensis]|uniref:Uncharacterized protein n=1 Tax=Trichonephila inaurata madagascariensis TaxID=2747483 RepID=A0A8X6X8Z8_9ARAC|nr:hypothetical protein TNIN_335191 [Trichonephila inaurata madagascariensis]